MNFYYSGIDVERLIYDLSFGVRLPNPAFCPKEIASLLRKCFKESPQKRPDFKEIKTFIKSDFEKLLEKSNLNLDSKKRGKLDDNQMPRYSPNIYKLTGSNEMKSRHSAIKKANHEKKRNDCQISSEDKTHDSVEIHQSHSPLNYTLLQTTSAKETTHHTLDSPIHTLHSMEKSKQKNRVSYSISFIDECSSDSNLAASIDKNADMSSSSNVECETIDYNTHPGYLLKSEIDPKRKKSIKNQDIANVV